MDTLRPRFTSAGACTKSSGLRICTYAKPPPPAKIRIITIIAIGEETKSPKLKGVSSMFNVISVESESSSSVTVSFTDIVPEVSVSHANHCPT